MAFVKATKSKSKLRLALSGPAGSGKTMTSLRIASGIGGMIGVIDTERGSASLYADRFQFIVSEIEDKSIDGYCAAMHEAAQAGVEVLIIDSLTHAWESLLEDVERIAKAKYRGNTWSAWNEGTPKQRLLVNAILDFPGHIIATMRSKTEWAEEKDERTGKMKPVRIGLAPMQGKGIEYEFSLLMELNTDHYATVLKDRTGKYQDKHIEKPGEDLGKELVEWLNTGAEVIAKTATETGRDLRVEHKTAAKGTGDAEFDAVLAKLPDLVKRLGSREALDKWLTIAKDLAQHPVSMPLSASLPEKRPALILAINLVESHILDGCLDPSDQDGIGEGSLRLEFSKQKAGK